MSEAEKILERFKRRLEGRLEVHSNVRTDGLNQYWLGRFDALTDVYSDLENVEKGVRGER